MKLKCGAGTWD